MSTAENNNDQVTDEFDPGGLTSAGQYLCASFVTFLGVCLVMLIVYLVTGGTPFDVGGSVILGAVSAVSLYCGCIGLLAKPQGKEWLFALPTLGPILPLLTAAMCVYIFVFAK